MTDDEFDRLLADSLAPPERAPDLAFVAMNERLVALDRAFARRRRAAWRRGLADGLAAAGLAASLGLWTLWRPGWADPAGAVLPLLVGLVVVAWLVGHDWDVDAPVLGGRAGDAP